MKTKKPESIKTLQTVVSFKSDWEEKRIKIYHSRLQRSVYIKKKIILYCHIYSDSIAEMLDSIYIYHFFAIGLTKLPSQSVTEESQTFFRSFFIQLNHLDKRHYISYFSLLKENPWNLNFRLNARIFYLSSLFFHSQYNDKKSYFFCLKGFLEKYLSRERIDCLFTRNILQMVEKLNSSLDFCLNFKMPSKKKKKKSVFSISLPLISLIYWGKLNQSDNFLNEFAINMSQDVKKGVTDVITRKNLSKFYQLELFKKMLHLTKSIQRPNSINLEIL